MPTPTVSSGTLSHSHRRAYASQSAYSVGLSYGTVFNEKEISFDLCKMLMRSKVLPTIRKF